MPKWRRR